MSFLQKRKKEVNKVVLIPLEEITRNPSQPRKYFDSEAMKELSRSIIANGLLQPITVRKLEDGQYELIAGERRLMAFESLGKDCIPAIVEDCTLEQSAVYCLIENLQRRDLNYFEEAAGIAQLMEQLELTQQEVSQRLGKAQSTVANKLRLLRYPPDLQIKMLNAGLTERHARALLKILEEDKLREVVEHIVQKNFNVEETEQYVDKLLLQKEMDAHTKLFIIKDVRIFLNSINKAVSTMNMAGIAAETQKSEDEEFVEYLIRIPKNAMYRPNKETADSAGAV